MSRAKITAVHLSLGDRRSSSIDRCRSEHERRIAERRMSRRHATAAGLPSRASDAAPHVSSSSTLSLLASVTPWLPGSRSANSTVDGSAAYAASPAAITVLSALRWNSVSALNRFRISLFRRASRRGARQLLPQHRWRADRRCCGTRLHCSARAGDYRSDAGCCRTAGDGSRGRAQALAPRRRAGELFGKPRRAPLSRRRSRQPTRRAWSQACMGEERRQNSHVARMSARACSRARSATVSVRSVLTTRRFGRRPPARFNAEVAEGILQCARPSARSGCRVRPCCSVSSVASSKPSISRATGKKDSASRDSPARRAVRMNFMNQGAVMRQDPNSRP